SHPFADDFSPRLVFRLHAQDPSLDSSLELSPHVVLPTASGARHTAQNIAHRVMAVRVLERVQSVRSTSDCVAKLSLRRLANRDSVGMGGDSRERSMMGRREDGQGQFFFSFDLDEVVPCDHLVRQIDAVLDLSWVHRELAPYYSHTG